MAVPYDVLVFGPTGVTGREVARYVGRRAPELGLTWAAAGRDAGRVEEALAQVGATPDAVMVADVTDAASIEAMVGATRVVVNLVGPYARYGEPVHRACAAAGVHQLDLTGEIDWVRAMIDRHDASAKASGAAIVPCAGFESLPFDVAARLAVARLWETTAEAAVVVDAAVAFTAPAGLGAVTDAVSGGTFASMVEMVRNAPGRLPDPFALDPVPPRPRQRFELRPRRHRGTGAWLAPLFPSPLINPPVLHRTAALARTAGEVGFAPTYRYREGTVTTSMLGGLDAPGVAPVVSATMAAAQGAVVGAQLLPQAARDLLAGGLARLGPAPGTGPRPETLDDWSYRIDVRAESARGASADVVVEAIGHPGYKSTATLVGEAALAIADMTAPRAGYVTPATVLAVEDLDRFAAAGATFAVVDG